MSSKTTIFICLGFAIVLTTPQAALQGNLVTVKKFLMMMVCFISRSSLRESLAESVRLGWKGWWLKIFVSLGFSILLWVTRFGWLLTWGRFVWKWKITRSPTKWRGLTDYLDMPQILLFCTLRFSCLYFLNLTKDWNVPNPLWKQFIIF